MIFTITDTATNLQEQMDAIWYTLSDQRFWNRISFWICHTTDWSQLYLSWSWVLNNWSPIDLHTETKWIESWETVVYEETTWRLDKIRMQAWTGQSITVYVDVRL